MSEGISAADAVHQIVYVSELVSAVIGVAVSFYSFVSCLDMEL